MDLVEVSAVVLAQVHNPTILHPSFLTAEHIVPADWELATPPISMPPLATATYKSGVSFTADESRLSVRDIRPLGGGERFRAFRLAGAYVQTLPHVPYTAVGINFHVFVAADDAQRRLREYIFSDDFFTGPLEDPQTFSVVVQHRMERGTRSLTISPAERDLGRPGISVNSNYHVVISAENRLQNTLQALEAAEARWNDLTTIMQIEQRLVN